MTAADPTPGQRAVQALKDGDLDGAIEALDGAEPIPASEMPDDVLPRTRMSDEKMERMAALLEVPIEEMRKAEQEAWAETVRRGLIDPATTCPKCGFEKTSAHCGRCGFITNGPEPALPTWGCFRTVPPNVKPHGPHDWTQADDAKTRYHCDGAA